LLLARREPLLGPVLVAAGLAVIVATWSWTAVITVPVGLVLVAVAFSRAWRPGWPRRSGAT